MIDHFLRSVTTGPPSALEFIVADTATSYLSGRSCTNNWAKTKADGGPVGEAD
jgi:hypothetical protein